MKIDIIENKAECIIFSSQLGSGSAVWCGGDMTLPGSYDVEIDFDSEYIWGENVFYSNDPEESISLCNGVNKINSKVISIDGDIVVISLGSDVIMIEVSGAGVISKGHHIFFNSPAEMTRVTPFSG